MKKSPNKYCSLRTQEQKRNGIGDLADNVVEYLTNHPNIIKEPMFKYEGTYVTYEVSFNVRFKSELYNVFMYFGYVTERGDIFIKHKGEIVSSGYLPKLLMNNLWDEAETRLPPETRMPSHELTDPRIFSHQ